MIQNQDMTSKDEIKVPIKQVLRAQEKRIKDPLSF